MMASDAHDLSRTFDSIEKAFRKFGDPSVVQEFDDLPRRGEVQFRMLESLASAYRDLTIKFSTEAMLLQQSGKSVHSRQPPNPKCPLVKALWAYGFPRDDTTLCDNDIDTLRSLTKEWGVSESSWSQLHKFEKARERFRKPTKGDGTERHVVTTSQDANKDESYSNVEWNNLKPIKIRDLKLFDTCKGCVLEGTLVTYPLTPMVGTSTLLQDSESNIVQLALYNFLPAGVHGDAADSIASTKLPKGAKLLIAEPFLKVFKNGARGIRIDNPHEVQVIMPQSLPALLPSPSFASIVSAMEKAKNQGNDFVSKKQYHAASETYISGLRMDNDFIPVLLSNRAQASINLEDWTAALADAAASLTLRPSCKKTWARYQKALAQLGGGCLVEDLESSKNILRIMLKADVHPIDVTAKGDTSAEELKAQGNQAFKQRYYENARYLYSQALFKVGGTVRAILSNWALCGLHTNAFHDALAASFASIRIWPEEKAIFRLSKSIALLGAPDVSLATMQKFSVYAVSSSFEDLKTSVEQLAGMMKTGSIFSARDLFLSNQSLFCNWCGRIETFTTTAKGRGVRATADLVTGEVILIEYPVAYAETNMDSQDRFVFSTSRKSVSDNSSTGLVTTVVNRSQRDALLATIVNNLYDGETPGQLVPMSSMLPNLGSVPICLPSHRDYMPCKDTQLTSKRVGNIASMNSFGTYNKDDGQKPSWLLHENSSLYAAMSMFNHSSKPNCAMVCKSNHVPGTQILMTNCPVNKGEELTICYHPDEKVLESHWGIQNDQQ